MKKKIMHFKSLEEEMEFWDTHDATEFEAKEVTVDEIASELAQRQNQQIDKSTRTRINRITQIKNENESPTETNP